MENPGCRFAHLDPTRGDKKEPHTSSRWWNVLQRIEDAFNHAREIGIDIRIPESKNFEALRLQKCVANLI
jgi:hypothetical protein